MLAPFKLKKRIRNSAGGIMLVNGNEFTDHILSRFSDDVNSLWNIAVKDIFDL
jgi:hypothetical protein